MDSKEKQGTWIDGIYSKVETLCAEIDNIISQESLQYAETQILTAGVNVKQFAEDKLSSTGASVKQFYSDFMEEVFPDFLKDSFIKKTQSEDTEKCDSSCDMLKKKDKRHKDEVSKSDNSDGISASSLSTVGNEMNLEQSHIKVNVIPSETSEVDVFEKNDVGMTTSNCRESHVGINEDSILLQPSYSSPKARRNAEPEPSAQDFLSLYRISASRLSTVGNEMNLELSHIKANGIPSETSEVDVFEKNDVGMTTSNCRESHVGIIDSRILEDEDDSTGGPDTAETGLNATQPLDASRKKQHHFSCPMLPSNKSCSASDLHVEKGKIEDGWEFMEIDEHEDHPLESDEPQGMRPKKSLQPKKLKHKNYCESSESCGSEWEFV